MAYQDTQSERNPSDNRVGTSFGNPDYESSYHAPNWGYILTADELRYDYLFGNELVSQTGNQTIENHTLLTHISRSIELWEKELNFDILPRMRRYRDPDNRGNILNNFNRDLSQEDIDRLNLMDQRQKGILFTSEGTEYDYNRKMSKQYFYLKLDHAPLERVVGIKLQDPMRKDYVDMTPDIISHEGLESVLEYYPRNTAFYGTNIPLIFTQYMKYPYDRFPNAVKVDYDTGFINASMVPGDLIENIGKVAAMITMAKFGDGKTSALAGGSSSFNSISESFQTTLSATSAMFGARIKQYQDEIKEWMKENKQKYQRTLIGSL